MDRILTVRQPYASALVHGVKDCEYRQFRIPEGTKVWIHAGLTSAMDLAGTIAFFDTRDKPTAEYLRWATTDTDCPRPELSKMAQSIYEYLGLRTKTILPHGYIIGWVTFGKSEQTTGSETTLGRYANMVDSFHALRPGEWRVHKGSLGLMPFGGLI